MAKSLKATTQLKGVEDLPASGTFAAAASVQLDHNGYDTKNQSISPLTAMSYRQYACVAGEYVVDLTSLPVDDGSTTHDATGEKLQAMKVLNPAGNAALVIEADGTDGYELFGASGKLTIPAGGEATILFNDGTPDVASGDKRIKFTLTGTQQFKLALAVG